jgi:hypothetical protein
MSWRKAVEALWKLSSCRGVIASDLGRLPPFWRKIFQSGRVALHELVEIMTISEREFHAHASLHIKTQK